MQAVFRRAPNRDIDLDPENWDEFRAEAHALLDLVISDLQSVRQRPVWQPAPQYVRSAFAKPLPRKGRGLATVVDEIAKNVIPYATGNRHPRFMGWVHGAGTAYGMLAEMVSGALNVNCGGRDHIGLVAERQITRWMAEALGYPDDASGIFVTGSSMANFSAVVVAKCRAVGHSTRFDGLLKAGHVLTAYASEEVHGCIAQAMELAGIGSSNLRLIRTTRGGGLDVARLEQTLEADRARGCRPFILVGTAGTVNTGAIDPLAELAALAKREHLWFHVDGAIGALAAFDADLRLRLAGIEASDSVALDFHKWGHVPYDAGFLLVRDAVAHKQAFAQPAAYLRRAERGLAGGGDWPCDFGPDLSRGFRALKTWVTLSVLGTERIGASISRNCRQARIMAALVQDNPMFELKAPVPLNIVCFGLRGRGRDALNREIVVRAQLSGECVPSLTDIDGETVIRCAIVNHRTTRRDVEAVVASLSHIANQLAAEMATFV